MHSAKPRPIWGWSAPVRGLLIFLTAIGACFLLIRAPSQQDNLEPFTPLTVDPNTAKAEVLLALPGLGPALVSRIVEARNEAPFQSLEDLDTRVKGIGPATIRNLRPHLQIEPRPIQLADDSAQATRDMAYPERNSPSQTEQHARLSVVGPVSAGR